MGNVEVATKIRRIIAEKLGRPMAEVLPAAFFVEDLDADSLDIVELVMAIEREFDIEIPDDEAEKIRTVQDAADYVNACMS